MESGNQSLLLVRASRVSDDELLRRYARSQDRDELEELVRRFTPLVRKLVRRYARAGGPVDDLEQVAFIGLVKSIRAFEPERGFAFSTFAVPTILGEMKRSFRNTTWAVHVPRALQERVAELRQASDDLSAERGRAPTVGELARRMGCGEELVLEALQARGARDATSLDAPAGSSAEDDGMVLLDLLAHVDEGYEGVEDREAIESALPALTQRERDMLQMRFEEGLKQSEIAIRCGCSQMQVSRVLRAGLERLSLVANRHSGPAR